MIQATQSSCLLEYLMVILHTSIEWSCKIKKKSIDIYPIMNLYNVNVTLCKLMKDFKQNYRSIKPEQAFMTEFKFINYIRF